MCDGQRSGAALPGGGSPGKDGDAHDGQHRGDVAPGGGEEAGQQEEAEQEEQDDDVRRGQARPAGKHSPGTRRRWHITHSGAER